MGRARRRHFQQREEAQSMMGIAKTVVMQVSLDDRVSQSIHRLVNYVAQNAITWVIIVAATAVVLTLLFTRKRK